MKMLVETYEIERSDEARDAINDGAAQEIIEKLGMEGQERFYKEETMEAIPYRKMTKDEGIIYGFLMPRKCSPEKYSDGLIPIRVLQVYEHAKSSGFFTEFEVWYPENADIKDPILLGIRKTPNSLTPQYAWMMDTEIYMLARWGEALDSIEEMRTCAVRIWKERITTKICEIESEVAAYKTAIANGAVYLENGMPSFHK